MTEQNTSKIRVQCPACNARLRVAGKVLESDVTCPKCKKKVRFIEAPPANAGTAPQQSQTRQSKTEKNSEPLGDPRRSSASLMQKVVYVGSGAVGGFCIAALLFYISGMLNTGHTDKHYGQDKLPAKTSSTSELDSTNANREQTPNAAPVKSSTAKEKLLAAQAENKKLAAKAEDKKSVEKPATDIVPVKSETAKEESSAGERKAQSLAAIAEGKGAIVRGSYRIRDDIIIPEGDTLVIEPGAKLFFYEEIGIIAHGKLVAKGTKDTLIVFNGTKWAHISLQGKGASSSILSFCKISHSTCRTNWNSQRRNNESRYDGAVSILGAEDCVIRDCVIQNDENIGIHCFNIQSATIERNIVDGVECNLSSLDIRNNIIRGATNSKDPEIRGVYCSTRGSDLSKCAPRITGNLIENFCIGIVLSHSSADICGNYIRNSIVGLKIQTGGWVSKSKIKDNYVSAKKVEINNEVKSYSLFDGNYIDAHIEGDGKEKALAKDISTKHYNNYVSDPVCSCKILKSSARITKMADKEKILADLRKKGVLDIPETAGSVATK